MKKAGFEVAQLMPAAHGWRTVRPGGEQAGTTMEEAISGLPPAMPLHLSLPCQSVLMERLVLPSQAREELEGMVALQLEKTLPYPIEEVTWSFDAWPLPVQEAEGETSAVLTLAVHTPVLEELCAPLQSGGRLPQRVACYAQQLAAQAPEGEVALLLWHELGQTVVALAERRHLSWAQPLTTVNGEEVLAELPGLLLTAEMQGVETNYTQVLLAPECAEWMPGLQAAGGQRFGGWPTPATLAAAGANLLPPSWQEAGGKHARRERLRARLILGGMLYLLLLAGAFLFLAFRKQAVQKLNVEIARTRPLIETTQRQQARWAALAPAVDPGRSAVGILYLVSKNRPQDDVRITVFDFAPSQFMVEGEAPSAPLAVDFVERLRKEPELSAFNLESGPPQILPNEHAQFRIFGKLP